MGVWRTNEEQHKQVLLNRWNPGSLTAPQRYLLSKGSATTGVSFFNPQIYEVDELHLLLNLKVIIVFLGKCKAQATMHFSARFWERKKYKICIIKIFLIVKVQYEKAAVKILSFCDESTESDPEMLSGDFLGDKAMVQAKKAESENRKTVGILRWEQNMRKVLGKSSSVKVNKHSFNHDPFWWLQFVFVDESKQ